LLSGWDPEEVARLVRAPSAGRRTGADTSAGSAAQRLAVVDASLKRLRPAQRALAMGERRQLFADTTGLNPSGAKFAAEHLKDAMAKLELSDRAVQLYLEFFDNIEHSVLLRLTEATARRANKVEVLRDELKDHPRDQQAQRVEEIIAAPARLKAKRQEGTFFEEFVKLYRRFDNKEHVQLHDVAAINEFLVAELGERDAA